MHDTAVDARAEDLKPVVYNGQRVGAVVCHEALFDHAHLPVNHVRAPLGVGGKDSEVWQHTHRPHKRRAPVWRVVRRRREDRDCVAGRRRRCEAPDADVTEAIA
eukprot:3941836-Rhodomonas_salina.2